MSPAAETARRGRNRRRVGAGRAGNAPAVNGTQHIRDELMKTRFWLVAVLLVGMAAGCDAIVTKPFEPMQLGSLLQQVLRGEEPEPPRGTSPGGGLRPLGT